MSGGAVCGGYQWIGASAAAGNWTMRARWYVGRAQNLGREGTNMWQYIIPAISAIVVAVKTF